MQELFRTILLTLLRTTVLLGSEKENTVYKMLESNKITLGLEEKVWLLFLIVHLTVKHLTCSHLPCLDDSLYVRPT